MPFQTMRMEKLTGTGKSILATVSADGQYVFNVHDDGGGTGKPVDAAYCHRQHQRNHSRHGDALHGG